jgi:hypothetical protein
MSEKLVEMELVPGEELKIRMRRDGMIDLTRLAQTLGLDLDTYLSDPQTEAFIKALSSIPGFGETKAIDDTQTHIFGHRLLVYNFVQGNPKMAMLFYGWIDGLMKNGSVSLPNGA